MTKQEIIGYVQSMFQREDVTQRYHERVVIAHVEKVLSAMYNDLYKVNPRLLSKYTKQYGVTTAIAISYEASTGMYYSTLPAQVVSLPSKSSGVMHIYPKLHAGNQFIPMDATEADMIFGSDVAVVTNKVGYRTRQDNRVDYWNVNAAVLASGVGMDLLIPFSVYADTDVVLIPELGEKEGGSFESRIYTSLQVIPPADLRDDNSATPTQSKQK